MWTLAAAAEQTLEARRVANAARRAEFVERMAARARREGRPDDWYLRKGREPPSAADIVTARRMGLDDKAAQARWWKERFGQHCLGHHVNGACPHLADERGCGFLHGDQDEPAGAGAG